MPISVAGAHGLDIEKGVGRAFVACDGSVDAWLPMLLRPEGLFPSARVRAELHAAEEDEGAVEQERAVLVDIER